MEYVKIEILDERIEEGDTFLRTDENTVQICCLRTEGVVGTHHQFGGEGIPENRCKKVKILEHIKK